MFGKGKIDIAVPKTNFVAGEVISGIATLNMKKRAKASEFTISWICDQKITERRGTSRSTRTDRIYEFEQQLDGEKEYEGSGTYPFEIKIPEDVLGQQAQMPQLEGTLGTALGIAQSLTGMGATKRTSWYLLARLDIPWGVDTKEKVQITIG